MPGAYNVCNQKAPNIEEIMETDAILTAEVADTAEETENMTLSTQMKRNLSKAYIQASHLKIYSITKDSSTRKSLEYLYC